MPFKVLLTADAYQDLLDICDYIAASDSNSKALYVLGKLETVINGLNENPERGGKVRELSELGIPDFREFHFKPYRIIYRVTNDCVYIMVVTDGRRDMQALLQRRLFETR